MNSYRVRWEVDQEAESPIEAAKEVWRRLFGRSYPPAPDSCCTFIVQDRTREPLVGSYGPECAVDLEQIAQDAGLELAEDCDR